MAAGIKRRKALKSGSSERQKKVNEMMDTHKSQKVQSSNRGARASSTT